MYSYLKSWFQKSSQVSQPGPLSTSQPTSETDIAESDKNLHRLYEQQINSMNDEEINSKFENLLNEMKLNEDKKKPLRLSSQENKKMMLVMNYKNTKQFKENKLDTPQHYISYLENCSCTDTLNPSNILDCVESLRIALVNNTLSWVHEFGSRGLQAIINVLPWIQLQLGRGDDNDTYETIQVECLKCITKFCNHAQGLKEFVRAHDGHVIIANCIDYRKPSVTIAALQILSLLCFIDDEGTANSSKLLSVLEKLGNLRKCNRFIPVIEGITMSSSDELSVTCLLFFNALLAQTTDLEFRKLLRNEIVRNGLCDKLDELRNHPTGAINEQLCIFESDNDEKI